MDTGFFKKADNLFLITLIERDDGTKKQVLEKTAHCPSFQEKNDVVCSMWYTHF